MSDINTELAQALCKAQANFEDAVKDATNPAFRNKYASLASVWEAARKPMTDAGLSLVQLPEESEPGTVKIKTMLIHSGGGHISSVCVLPVTKQDAQGYGSAITYARRYAMMAMLGICADDDDGQGATQHTGRTQESRATSAQFPGERGKPAQGANTGVPAKAATETIVEAQPSEAREAWGNAATVQKNIRTLLEALGKPKIGEIPVEWKVGAWAERLCGLPWDGRNLEDLQKLEAALQKYVDAMNAGGYEPGEEWNCAIGLALSREVIPDSIADLNAEELPKLLAWLTRTGA